MVFSSLAALPRRVAVGLLAWVSDNPLRVSGAVMALAATARLVERVDAGLRAAGIGPGGAPSTAGTALTLASDPTAVAVVVAIATGHPAYVVAAVVGAGAFLAWR